MFLQSDSIRQYVLKILFFVFFVYLQSQREHRLGRETHWLGTRVLSRLQVQRRQRLISILELELFLSFFPLSSLSILQFYSNSLEIS